VLASSFPNSSVPRDTPWWKFWQSDEVLQLLEHNTVPKSVAE